jgi:hypothetical protein
MATDAEPGIETNLREWAVAKAREIRAASATFPKPKPIENRPFTPEEQKRRSEQIREALAEMLRIGTEEERRESAEILMNALAETRRAEGRVF